MATTAKAKQTAALNRYKALKANTWKAADYVPPAEQRKIMASQWWISNIQPWDVSFGTGSQTWQWSQYNMYPTWSYNTQVARYWDPTSTWNQPVDSASWQIIWQFAQYERAIEPEASSYIDTAARLQKEDEARLTSAKNAYTKDNQALVDQNAQYYKWLWDYNQSEQSAQQAFAANEARRATGSQQAATAAGQRVWAQYVGQSLQAQQQDYAEKKALMNELNNYIKDYNAQLKAGADQYDLGTRNKLLETKAKLATDMTNQQVALLGQNLWSDLNEQAAQRAFIRQQALAAQAAALNKSSGWTSAAAPSTATTVSIPTSTPNTWLTFTWIRSNTDQSVVAQWSDGKTYQLTKDQANVLRSTWKLR